MGYKGGIVNNCIKKFVQLLTTCFHEIHEIMFKKFTNQVIITKLEVSVKIWNAQKVIAVHKNTAVNCIIGSK